MYGLALLKEELTGAPAKGTVIWAAEAAAGAADITWGPE